MIRCPQNRKKKDFKNVFPGALLALQRSQECMRREHVRLNVLRSTEWCETHPSSRAWRMDRECTRECAHNAKHPSTIKFIRRVLPALNAPSCGSVNCMRAPTQVPLFRIVCSPNMGRVPCKFERYVLRPPQLTTSLPALARGHLKKNLLPTEHTKHKFEGGACKEMA